MLQGVNRLKIVTRPEKSGRAAAFTPSAFDRRCPEVRITGFVEPGSVRCGCIRNMYDCSNICEDLMKIKPVVSRPVKIAVIGAGNRADKYLEYARRYPGRLQLVAVVELNELRRRAMADRFGLPEDRRYVNYDDFFADRVEADMVLVSTPENAHFDPAIKAIDAGYHLLLEKPIAQRLDECREIARRARERGVRVGVCHVLRYHPYFAKIRELVASGEFGRIVSVNHIASVGLDRATHSYVRGIFRRVREANPILLAKCCHDIDFLLWLTRSRCSKLSSFGSLQWFRAENAPAGAGERCLDCKIETQCPFSARDLYYVRRDWVASFDVPEGMTLDDAILEELRTGLFGRCVSRCDNDVVDRQLLSMEMDDAVVVSLSMEMFSNDDFRRTHIWMTGGEIDGDERTLRVRKFRGGYERTYDFSDIAGQSFHAGADLYLIDDFIQALYDPDHVFLTSIEDSIESHRICYEAERSRRTGETIRMDE